MDRRTYLVWAGSIATLTGSDIAVAQEQNGDDENEILSVGDLAELDELPFDTDVVAELEGEGSRVTDEFELGRGLAMLVYESENVDDEGIEADLEQIDGDDSEIWAIDEIVFFDSNVDEVTGSTLVQVEGGEYILDIGADGAWDVHVVQLEAPEEEVRSPPVSVSGEHSTVVGPVEADGGLTISGEHQNEEYDRGFNVMAFPEDPDEWMDYAFIEDAGFEGESRVDAEGVTWIEINTLGEWTIDIED